MHVYDDQIARHYAAYRPPLHRLIVDEVLNGRQFETGLDIGCGTGYSAVALLAHCEQVFAVDRSEAMLSRALKDPKVTYLLGTAVDLPIDDAAIDIVTFAGVLSYLNVANVVPELKRVCRRGAFVCPYDFKVIVGDLMQMFSPAETHTDDPYNHACDLSGHLGISTLKRASRLVEISITAQQAAHILLSNKSHYDSLVALFGSPRPLDLVVETLKQKQWSGKLKAKVYYALHRLNIDR